jgi:NAD(P)-dependent dehydrogenase (short-subunit alcohol dehydrogenase family)
MRCAQFELSNSAQPVLRRLFSLEGSTALITGAAGGIGRVLAAGVAEAGAAVVLADVDGQGAAAVATDLNRRGLSAMPVTLDLAKRRSITEMLRKVVSARGAIDVLVNCAAINRRQPILEVDPTTFDRILAVNLRGLFQLSQQVATQMIQQGGGKIIHIGSINSKIGLAGVSVYGATKGAVSQLTTVMAVEWARYNIQVNCIAPGFMRTPLTEPLWRDRPKANWMRGRIAMGRPGNPEELIGITLLLASSASSYITGQTFFVDGGLIAGGRHW